MIDNSINKRHLYLITAITFMVFIIGVILINSKLFGEVESIKDKQIKSYYQMAGSDNENIYYTIADILKGNIDKEAINKGEEFLNNQGFTYSYIHNYVKLGDRLKNKIITYNIILILLFAVAVTIIIIYMKNSHKKELTSILHILEKFNKGEYDYTTTISNESINSKINYRLASLGEMITIKNTRLQQEKEETKALVTDISHQLKTPLASLKMCFSLMLEDDLMENEKEEFIERSKEQINRLEGLVAALVNISRLETGLISIRTNMNDIKETIIQAVNSVYMKAEKKKIHIEMEQIQSISLPYDEKWTKEAISNVIDNAIKYSPKESTITIRTQKLHNYLRIEIEDEGIGVKEKDYNDIFKRFYRGKNDLIKKQEGSGVGLYLTRKILEDQGGNIKAISKSSLGADNVGSIFVLQLLLE
ncbi:two-component sensor histidine kinase [Vallitalea longa]|uniref:histidine kinase n=1 Tax=Vallitalea longa TaxID=2936439 RepID=A0A9W5Y979_9FIRM|nr:ATP-binding protein [Vallitalea longa]GKX29575.1 two-component sensor histidine kinase [Vallitalea longa]